jgi:ankyrin repeat protein
MNIEKADYVTVVKFGSIEELNLKLYNDGKMLDEVIGFTDERGMSLLEHCLSSRKFDIAEYLLNNNARVNVVSKEGCNEFHYIASNINCEGALKIAKILLERGTSLRQKDIKYGNSAIYTLCLEILKVCSNEGLEFMKECLKNTKEFDDCNKRGFSIRTLINERGTEALKQLLIE